MPSKIDFYGLPRPVQERFAAATRGSAPPAPLLFRSASRRGAWLGLGAAAMLLFGLAALFAAGFGDVRSALALHDHRVIAVDMFLLAAASYCLLYAAGTLISLEALPWRAGIYLFPGCAVDARRSRLHVWPIDAVVSVEMTGAGVPGIELHMRDGSRVVVPASSADQAERAQAALESVRRSEAHAIELDDSRVMVELDPLHDRAMSNPIGPTEGMRPRVPLWMRLDWAIAALVGVALGQGLATTRNVLSDRAMFRAASLEGTSSGYEAYLRRGGRRSGEVRDVLLPRVQLREAEAKGSVDAVLAFARSHPSSKIGPEIDASLRRALLVELDKAKSVGTVTALDAFGRQYPGPLVDAELRAARHALFVRAIAVYRAKAHPEPAADAFMGRLVDWAETNGQPVQVRFRPKPSDSLDDADKSLVKFRHYPGPEALPSRYVTPEVLRLNERAFQDAIAKQFGDAFPADVLAVRAGDPLSADEPSPSAVPALVIEYSPEWSRGNTTCQKPRTVFSGLSFMFDASFSVPDAQAPLKATVKAWRAAEPWRVKDEDLSFEQFEQRVYGAMIAGAFDQLKRKMIDFLF